MGRGGQCGGRTAVVAADVDGEGDDGGGVGVGGFVGCSPDCLAYNVHGYVAETLASWIDYGVSAACDVTTAVIDQSEGD